MKKRLRSDADFRREYQTLRRDLIQNRLEIKRIINTRYDRPKPEPTATDRLRDIAKKMGYLRD